MRSALAPAALLLCCAVALAPGWATGADGVVVLRLRAAQLAGGDRCEEALAVARQARQRYPEDAALARVEGLCAGRLGRYGEAIEPLETALRLDPGAAEVAVQLGVAHYQLEQHDAARAAMDAAAALDPEDAELLFYQGLLALRAERHAEAGALLSRAVARDPEFIEPYGSYYAGEAWVRAGEREKAERALARVVELAPDSDAAEQASAALKRLTAVAEKRRRITLQAGIEWDSNAVLRGQDVVLPEDISDDGDWRGVWSLELGQVLWRNKDWALGVVGGYYGFAYFDLDDFDLHYPSISLWLDRRIDEQTFFRLQPDFAYGWRRGDPYVLSYGLTASLERDWSAWGGGRLHARYGRHNFLFSPLDEEDGSLTEEERRGIGDAAARETVRETRELLALERENGGITVADARTRLNPLGTCSPAPSRSRNFCGPLGLDEERQRNRDGHRWRIGYDHQYKLWESTQLRGGLSYEYYAARGQEYSYQGVEPWLGAERELFFKISVEARASYQYRRYRHRSTFPDPGALLRRLIVRPPGETTGGETFLFQYNLAASRRREDLFRTELEFSRPLNEWLTASLRWRYHNVSSNRDVFDYDRHQIGMFLKAEFSN